MTIPSQNYIMLKCDLKKYQHNDKEPINELEATNPLFNN